MHRFICRGAQLLKGLLEGSVWGWGEGSATLRPCVGPLLVLVLLLDRVRAGLGCEIGESRGAVRTAIRKILPRNRLSAKGKFLSHTQAEGKELCISPGFAYYCALQSFFTNRK